MQEERNAALTPAPGSGAPTGSAVPPAPRTDGLPKELSWFRPIDADGDGQISLYEWRTSGRALEEFRRMDRNDDGFLTVAEAVYSGRNPPPAVAVASPPDPRGSGGRSFGPPGKGSGPFGKGPGR